MNKEIAKEIFLTHCKRHNLEPEWFYKKWGNKVAKVYNNHHIDWHRQILCLYIKDNVKITDLELAKILGYRDHTTVIYNLRKFRKLFIENNDVIHERYADIASWADTLIHNE